MAASTVRATCWSVTINNPTQSDDEQIALARQKSGWKVYGQREKGAQGTEHYQLMITTPQVRWAALKKAFPRAHVEAARDRTALAKYVEKEDTKIGELDTTQDQYPSMMKLWDMLAEWIQETRRHHMWLDASPEKRLVIFDQYIRDKIDEGYIVETLAVNPQIRSCVKQFGENIYFRSLRRQTDRQTPDIKVAPEDINNGTEEDCNEEGVETLSSSSTDSVNEG